MANTKRLIAVWEDGHCNVPATRIEYEQGYAVAFNGDEFVGVFDIGFINVLYISEARNSSEMKTV